MPRIGMSEFNQILREHLSCYSFDELAQKAIMAVIMPAIVKVESDFNPYAGRFERSFRYTVDPSLRPIGCSIETELFWQKCSWGLTQIMGAVARENGFSGWLSELVDPWTNLLVSVRHMVKLGKRYKWVQQDMISAWNAGSPRRKVDGSYVNQGYVDNVISAIRSKEY